MTDKATKPPKTGLALMREPFPANLISKLPKPTKQQTDAVRDDYKAGIRCDICGGWHHPKVVHLDYVGHAALTDRLLDCDPEWNWEPVAVNEDGSPKINNDGMWIRLTVCNVTRLGYGNAEGKKGGDAVKEIIGDALRNAGMRFGAALDLWHKGELHVDDAEEKPMKTTAGPPDAHDALVQVELKKLATIEDMDELKSYWSALNSMQRSIAEDNRVIIAKNKVKNKLAPPPEKPGSDVDSATDDAVPY